MVITNKKKKIITVIGVVLILVILITDRYWQNQKEIVNPSPSASAVPISELSAIDRSGPETIDVSGVIINNPIKTAVRVGKIGDTLFVNEKEFKITYYPQAKEFLIVILSIQYDSVKKEAQEVILQQLNISKEEACRLKIHITSPQYLNPHLAGKIDKPDYCQ